MSAILFKYTKLFFNEIWSLLLMMAPYLLIGMFVSGLISIFINKDLVFKHIGSKTFTSIFKSTIFGVPMPLCSCGVIPVAATLKESGASKGATIAFLVSTPQTGFDSIFLTYGMLGPVFAIFRPVAAFISGLISGVIINKYDDDEHYHTTEVHNDTSGGHSYIERIKLGVKYGFYTLPKDIVVPLFQGIIIAAVISVLIPPNFIAENFSSQSNIMYFLMLLVSLPVYVCATASIPIGLALMAKGLSAGAVFVFLMAGPATNAASINVVKNILGKKTMYFYLSLISSTAIIFGFILDSFAEISIPKMIQHSHEHSNDGYGTLFLTIFFLIILIHSYLVNYDHSKIKDNSQNQSSAKKEKVLLVVKGMTCSHCKDSVETAANSCEGVEETIVDLATGQVTILGKGFESKVIKEKIINRGFTISS